MFSGRSSSSQQQQKQQRRQQKSSWRRQKQFSVDTEVSAKSPRTLVSPSTPSRHKVLKTAVTGTEIIKRNSSKKGHSKPVDVHGEGSHTDDEHDNHNSHNRLSIGSDESVNTVATDEKRTMSSLDFQHPHDHLPQHLCGGADLEIIRRKQIQHQALINAMNHFILQAGNIYRGKKLSNNETEQLYDVASQVGLAQSVVDALVSTASNPNAVIEYCLHDSHCAFARRIQADPYLRRILNAHQNHQYQHDDGDDNDEEGQGLNLTSSIWRVFMHKIIQQFLQKQNLQLADVMDSSSLTSRLYEEAFRDDHDNRNDIESATKFISSVDRTNNRLKNVRDYTEERKRIMITEPDAKMARLEAEANIKFRRRKPFQDFVDRESNGFQPNDSFRENCTPEDDDELSILAPGAGRRSSIGQQEKVDSQYWTTSTRNTIEIGHEQTPRRSLDARDRWTNSTDIHERTDEEESGKPSGTQYNMCKSIAQKDLEAYKIGVKAKEDETGESVNKVRGYEVTCDKPKKSIVSKTRAIFERGVQSKSVTHSQHLQPRKIRDSLVQNFQTRHEEEKRQMVIVSKRRYAQNCSPQNTPSMNESRNEVVDSACTIGTESPSNVDNHMPSQASDIPQAREDQMHPKSRSKKWQESLTHQMDFDDSSSDIPAPPTKRDSMMLYMTRTGSEDTKSSFSVCYQRRDDERMGTQYDDYNRISSFLQDGDHENAHRINETGNTPFANIPTNTMDIQGRQTKGANSSYNDGDNYIHPKSKEKQRGNKINRDESKNKIGTKEKFNRNSVSSSNENRNWENFDNTFQESSPPSNICDDLVMTTRSEEDSKLPERPLSRAPEDDLFSTRFSENYFEKLLKQEIDPPIDYDQHLGSYSSASMEANNPETQRDEFTASQTQNRKDILGTETTETTSNQWENFEANMYESMNVNHKSSGSNASIHKRKPSKFENTSGERPPSELSSESKSHTPTTESGSNHHKYGTNGAMAQLSMNGAAFMVPLATTDRSRIHEDNYVEEAEANKKISQRSNWNGKRNKRAFHDVHLLNEESCSAPFRDGSRSNENPSRSDLEQYDRRHATTKGEQVYQRQNTKISDQKSPIPSASRAESVRLRPSMTPTSRAEMKTITSMKNRELSDEILHPIAESTEASTCRQCTPKRQILEVEALEEYRSRYHLLRPKNEDGKERRIRETILKLAGQKLDQEESWTNINEFNDPENMKTRRSSLSTMTTSVQPLTSIPREDAPLDGHLVDSDDYEEDVHSKVFSHEAPDSVNGAVLEIKNSFSTLSNMLRVDTASTCDDDDDDDDVGLNSPSGHIESMEQGAVSSRSPYYQSNVRRPRTEEEEIRAAAKQNGIPSPVINIILRQTRNTSDHDIAAEVLTSKAKYDSDTGLPASARHLHSASQSISPFRSSPRIFEGSRLPSRSAFAQNIDHYLGNDEGYRPDPSPESQRQSEGVTRTEPEGASQDAMALLNSFIEVASGDLGVQTLSNESEKKLRDAARKVGLTPKFVDQVLNQIQKKAQPENTSLATPATTAIAGSGRNRFEHNSTSRPGIQDVPTSQYRQQDQPEHQHQESRQDQYHQYPPQNQADHSPYIASHYQYFERPNTFQRNDYVVSSMYSPSHYPPTVDLTRTTHQTKQTQASYDGGCGNIWENLSKNILESWMKCTTGATTTATARRSSDDASSISSAQSWDYQHRQKKQKYKQPHHGHHNESQGQQRSHQQQHDQEQDQHHRDSGRRNSSGRRNGRHQYSYQQQQQRQDQDQSYHTTGRRGSNGQRNDRHSYEQHQGQSLHDPSKRRGPSLGKSGKPTALV